MSDLVADIEDLWPEPIWKYPDDGNLSSVGAEVGPLRLEITKSPSRWFGAIFYYDCTEDVDTCLFEVSHREMTVVIRTMRGVLNSWCHSVAKTLGMKLHYKYEVTLPRGVRRSLRDFSVDIEAQLRQNPFVLSALDPHAALHRISSLLSSAKDDTLREVLCGKEYVEEAVRILDLDVKERQDFGNSLYPILVEIAALVFHVDEMTRSWRKRFME